jgi:hypothetical protein
MKENFPMWVEEEEEDLTQTYVYPICTINTSLTSSQVDEDTFISNFLQNQYPVDVRIDGINDEEKPETSIDNSIYH